MSNHSTFRGITKGGTKIYSNRLDDIIEEDQISNIDGNSNFESSIFGP